MFINIETEQNNHHNMINLVGKIVKALVIAVFTRIKRLLSPSTSINGGNQIVFVVLQFWFAICLPCIAEFSKTTSVIMSIEG